MDILTMLSLLMTSSGSLGYTLLKDKDEVFSKVQEFKTLVETMAGMKIKILRFDNDREFISGKQKFRESLQFFINQGC